MIVVSDSELYDSIVKSIEEFDFSVWEMHDVQSTKGDRWAREWMNALAKKIEKDWVNYVDGLT